MALSRLAKLLLERRADRGIRQVAKEMGVSPATLSRVERGKLPDLVTFQKICMWLHVDPKEILDLEGKSAAIVSRNGAVIAAHFRADVALTKEAANDLAQLIVFASQEAVADGE